MTNWFVPFSVSIILLWLCVSLYVRQPTELSAYFWPALTFKLVAGFTLGYLYLYHYGTGDTITFWSDGKLVAAKISGDPLNAFRFLWDENPYVDGLSGLINDRSRSFFFVKICGLLALLSSGNYWMMSVIMSLVSFLASWYLFRKISSVFTSSKWTAAAAFLFFPSVVFWSSGLIKESLGLASLFFLAGLFLTNYDQGKIKFWEWITGLISLWVLWNLKYYWMGIFIPVVFTTSLVKQLIRLRPSLIPFELILWLGLFSALLVTTSSIHPNFYPSRFLEVIVQNNREFMELTAAENAVHYNDLQPTFQSVLINSPQAFIAGLFRPFIWESYNVLSCIASIENLILLGLVLTSVASIRHSLSSTHRMLILAVLIYITVMAIFLALSTPNLGTLSRYKIGFLPFLVFIVLYKNPLVNLVRSKFIKH